MAVLRKFMWFLLSKFARKCKFTRLAVINILTFAASFAKHLLHTGRDSTSIYHMSKIQANFSNAFNL